MTQAIEHVLVVGADKSERAKLVSKLCEWGHQVVICQTADAALEIVNTQQIDMILSEWQLPEMTGADLCRLVRHIDVERYILFVLLFTEDERREVLAGLGQGADDFLQKPFSSEKLRARIHAAERILRVQRELMSKNDLISKTLIELQTIHASVQRDLNEARKFQRSLVLQPQKTAGNLNVSLHLQTSGPIGGDMVGHFPAGPDHLGIYAIDVSGHGIASALMTARIASLFSAATPDQNIALTKSSTGQYSPLEPDRAAHQLNQMMLKDSETDLYFTMILAFVHLSSGDVNYVQAGHPYPAIVSPTGEVQYLCTGGMPIGLLQNAVFETNKTKLNPGDQLILASDGFTEGRKTNGTFYDQDGLMSSLQRHHKKTNKSLFEALISDLESFLGHDVFDDDISAAIIHRV